MDYDRNIHHNPDAMAWAKFFVETTKDMGREVFCDESYMVGWFANAMMAMHDSMKPHEAADEIKRLREALKPFAEIADDWDHLDDEDYVSVHKYDIELRHFRAIRSALQQKENE